MGAGQREGTSLRTAAFSRCVFQLATACVMPFTGLLSPLSPWQRYLRAMLTVSVGAST